MHSAHLTGNSVEVLSGKETDIIGYPFIHHCAKCASKFLWLRSFSCSLHEWPGDAAGAAGSADGCSRLWAHDSWNSYGTYGKPMEALPLFLFLSPVFWHVVSLNRQRNKVKGLTLKLFMEEDAWVLRCSHRHVPVLQILFLNL